MSGEFEMPEPEDMMGMGMGVQMTPNGAGGFTVVPAAPAAHPIAGNPMFGPYMNNPFGLPMQKCMDNDMCQAWTMHQSMTNAVAAATATTAAADTGVVTSSTSTGTASSEVTEITTPTTPSAPVTPAITPVTPASPMFGALPLGFHPEMFGLDPDAQLKDCMDEASCMQGLMAFQATRPGASTAPIMFPLPSMTLQRPRVLRSPRATYGAPALYGYATYPVYYRPVYYY